MFRKPSSQYTRFFEQVLIYFKCPSGITNQQSKFVASSPPISAWVGTKEEMKIGRAEEKCHYSSDTHPPLPSAESQQSKHLLKVFYDQLKSLKTTRSRTQTANAQVDKRQKESKHQHNTTAVCNVGISEVTGKYARSHAALARQLNKGRQSTVDHIRSESLLPSIHKNKNHSLKYTE